MHSIRIKWFTFLVCLALAGALELSHGSWASEKGQPPAASSRPPAGNTADTDRGESPSRTEVERPTDPAETKPATEPLKPFTPSEEIEVDQAVDFPYDI